MLKYLSFVLTALFASTGSSCPRLPGQASEIPIEGIRWVRSHEEDQGDQWVYRMHDHPFPPSRGRPGFQLNRDGSAIVGSIAPTDGVTWGPAHWTLSADSLLEIVVKSRDSNAVSRYHYRLVSLDSGKLSVLFIKRHQQQGR